MDVTVRASAATAGDLARAVGLGGRCRIDGQAVDSTVAVDDLILREGTLISAAADRDPAVPAERAGLVAVDSGLSAGQRLELPIGVWCVIGRSPQCDIVLRDPAVSWRHMRLRCIDEGFEFDDLGGRNGTVLDGEPFVGRRIAAIGESGTTIVVGSTRVRLSGVGRCAVEVPYAAAPTGLVEHHRPPRLAGPPDPEPVPPPPPLETAPPAVAFSWVSLLGPLALAVPMAVLFDPRFALFALLSPVMVIGTWCEGRRRSRRHRRRRRAQIAAGVAGLHTELTRFDAAVDAVVTFRHPGMAEIVRRAAESHQRLWERRIDDDHALAFAIGEGVDARPPALAAELADDYRGRWSQLLADRATHRPIEIDLLAGEFVGFVGVGARSLVRAVVAQLCVHVGPADLALRVLVSGQHGAGWHWADWLPHARDAQTGHTLGNVALSGSAAAQLAAGDEPDERLRLLVVDGADLWRGRSAPAARMADAGDSVSGLVVADDPADLPARCRAIVAVDGNGTFRLDQPGRPGIVGAAWGMDGTDAESLARALAGLDDPALRVEGAGLARSVSFADVLGIAPGDVMGVAARWEASAIGNRFVVPVGLDGHGPLPIDLVADGPHALVGGTTGSGKSELLRALVAGLAATVGPDRLAFVLIDYKGGSAFDRCEELPHVVDVITDLDPALAERALQAMEAELERRERVLRAAGVDDIARVRVGEKPPLPRLLLVIDEFATLATELPEFLDALIAIAQRGRSLGVHLVLATQRPGGVVRADIRTNTNIRIGLRMLDDADSREVLDVGDAAAISRSVPGRALVRLGQGELHAFQSVFASAAARRCGEVAPVAATPWIRDRREATSADEGGASDLDVLVAAVGAAAVATGVAAVAPPWAPPLPEWLDRTDALARAGGARSGSGAKPRAPIVGLSDHPRRLAQELLCWSPADGTAVVFGSARVGVSSTLRALALAALEDPRVALYGIAPADGPLRELADVAGVGSVAGRGDDERQHRTLDHVERCLRQRSGSAGCRVDGPVVLVIDDLDGWLRAMDERTMHAVRLKLERLVHDGPTVGVTVILGCRRPDLVTSRLASGAAMRLVHALVDDADYPALGLRAPASSPPAGRAYWIEGAVDVQVLAPAAVTAPRNDGRVDPIRVLGDNLRIEDLAGQARAEGDEVAVVVGARVDDLDDAWLRLERGSAAVIAGPPGSGRTAALALIAHQLVGVAPTVVFGPDRPAEFPDTSARLLALEDVIDVLAEPVVVLVDRADELDDPLGDLARALGRPGNRAIVIGAVRTDRYRMAFGHWSQELRVARSGVILRPEPIDNDLLGCELRVTGLRSRPGRAVLVHGGDGVVVQIARRGSTA